MLRTIGVLATPQIISPSAPTTGVTGLAVFITQWTRAICRHHKEMARVHFFVPPDQEGVALQTIATWGDNAAGCRVFTLHDLPHQLRQHEYVAFHVPGGPRLGTLANVLRCLSPRAIPVTANLHAVSYPAILDHAFSLLLSSADQSDAIICPSAAAARAHQEVVQHAIDWARQVRGVSLSAANQWRVIPHGIDTELYKPGPRELSRRNLGLPSDAPIAILSGRLTSVDKADPTPVLRILRNDIPSLHLILAGDDKAGGASQVTYMSQVLGITDRVHVYASVPQCMLLELYRSSDFAVFPYDSVAESFGLTLLEAMACGLPVIASRWSAFPEIVMEGKTGFLVDTSVPSKYPTDLDALAPLEEYRGCLHLALAQTTVVDPRLLALSMKRLVADLGLRARMGEEARRIAVSRYDWKGVIAQYESAWLALSGVRRKARDTPIGVPFPVTKIFRPYASTAVAGEGLLSPTPQAWDWREMFDAVARSVPMLSQSAAERVMSSKRGVGGPLSESSTVDEELVAAWLLKHGYVKRRGRTPWQW